MYQLDFLTDIPMVKGAERPVRGILKTYLRYPGGKSRAVRQMHRFVPAFFDEYREPMIGGGGMFLYMIKHHPEKRYWINDIYRNLYLFWVACRDNAGELIDALLKIKNETTRDTAGDKFQEIKATINEQDDFTRAVYFYYLNKCSFSGLTESGTCSPQAWVQNFSHSAIESLYDLKYILMGVKITNLDYSDLLSADGDGVFVYLDPPYDIGRTNVLYGRNGETHRNFDHVRFAENVLRCRHKTMVSYNDSEILRERYRGLNLHNLPLRYTMRIMEKNAPRKNELLITNYELQ